MSTAIQNEKQEKIICYLLNGKRDYQKERKMAKLFSEMINEINLVSYNK